MREYKNIRISARLNLYLYNLGYRYRLSSRQKVIEKIIRDRIDLRKQLRELQEEFFQYRVKYPDEEHRSKS